MQVGSLQKTNLTGSVASALESFSFLDLTEVGVKPDNELRPSDTGYFSSSTVEEMPKLGQTIEVSIP